MRLQLVKEEAVRWDGCERDYRSQPVEGKWWYTKAGRTTHRRYRRYPVCYQWDIASERKQVS